MPPYSVVRAASCASLTNGPRAWPSISICRRLIQCWSPGANKRQFWLVEPLIDKLDRFFGGEPLPRESWIRDHPEEGGDSLPRQSDRGPVREHGFDTGTSLAG